MRARNSGRFTTFAARSAAAITRGSVIRALIVTAAMITILATNTDRFIADPVQTLDAPTYAANTSRIKMPFAAGQQWRVLQGYNTSPAQSGSHWNCDPATLKDLPSQTESCRVGWMYKYSLDLVRSDRNTAGQQVVSPVNGTIRWIDESTGGMSINLGDGYAVAYFHTRINPSLAAGQTVRIGQVLGTVAPAGEANAGSTPHIHLTVWQTNDGGNWNRNPVPFTGVNSVDGYSFPNLGDSSRNQHLNAAVTSTNQPLSTGPATPAAPTLTSPQSGTTAKTSNVAFAWNAVSGATSYQVVIDGTTTSPWVTTTNWTSGSLAKGTHSWQVRARNATGSGPLSMTWAVTTPAPSEPSTPVVSLGETGGPVGTTLTVSGSGFGSGETVGVRWDAATAAPLATVRANGSGAFNTQITVPDATSGAHKVFAIGTSSKATAAFTVKPSLARAPTQGAPWDRITVTVRGFGASENVQLNWNTASGPVLGTVRTNNLGTGSIVIAVPNDSPGWHDYTGVGGVSKVRAYGAINVLSSVTLYPTSSAPAKSVRVVGRGFAPGASARATFNRSTTACTRAIAGNGTLDCTFTVPKVGAGVYPVEITAGGITKSASLIVTGPPSVSLTPPNSAVGTLVTVSVGGFAPREQVVLTWDSGATWQTVRVSDAGATSVESTVPELSPGNHTLKARGISSGKSSTLTYAVASAPAQGASSKVANGTYSVFATREGLVGGTTSNGHKIVEDDLFVSLPACTTTSCPGGAYWGQQTTCADKCYVRVVNPATNVCRVEPIFDTGPWFRVDDWWNTTENRYLNGLSSNPNTLTQGYVGAVAARDRLDVGYGKSPEGLGYDDTGTSQGRPMRVPGNDSAIDLADGTWRKLGLSGNVGSTVTVQMLWQTGTDPSAAAAACGHPLNQTPGSEVTFPSAPANPSFTGQPLAATGSAGSPNGATSLYARDGRFGTWWRTYTGDSASGQFVIDYGKVSVLTGVRWSFAESGFADQMLVETSIDRVTWTTVGTYGSSSAGGWYGVPLNRSGRYVRYTFANPNIDTLLGYVAEVQLWGNKDAMYTPGTANPSFAGAPLPPTGSAGSSNGATSLYVRDRDTSTWWRTYTGDSASGQFVIDYGRVLQLTGIRWNFSQTGWADQMTVETSRDRSTWTKVNTYGNAPAGTWYGVATGRQGRYVRFTFANPNGDVRLGYVAEVETWGAAVEANPPGTANPSFEGNALRATSAATSSNGSPPGAAYDGNAGTWWRTYDPSRGVLTIDYGAVVPLTGVRWMFGQVGSADQMLIETSSDRRSWNVVGTYGNAPDTGWRGVNFNRDGRYLRFTLANPNGDSRLGYLSEVELWGIAEQTPIAGSNPQFTGAPLTIRSSSASSGSNASAYAHDGTFGTSWYSTVENPGSILITLDLGSTQQLSGIRWTYRISGGADRMRLQISSDGSTWTQLVTTSNRVPYTWEGWKTSAQARYVRLIFENPNSRPVLGYLSEVEVWGAARTTMLRTIAPAAIPTVDTGTPVASPVAQDPPPGTPVATTESLASPVAAKDQEPETGVSASPIAAEQDKPGTVPTLAASPAPTSIPTAEPTFELTLAPTVEASPIPTSEPAVLPTGEPTAEQAAEPTVKPTAEPPAESTAEPTVEPTAVPTAQPASIGYIAGTDGDGANCRIGPSPDDDVIELLPEGTEIMRIGEPVDDWQQVECGDTTGWVFAEYVADAPPEEPTAEPIEPETAEELETPVTEDSPTAEPTVETSDEGIPVADAEPTATADPTAEPMVEPTPTPVPTPEPVLTTRQLVIDVDQDTSVSGADPSLPQSSEDVYALPIGGEEGEWTVLTFSVDGVAEGTVVNATLVITGSGDSAGPGGPIEVVPGTWFDESSTTRNDVENAGGYNIGYVDWVAPGVQTRIDLTGVVTADGTVSFVIKGERGQIAAIASSENGTPAYLVIDVEEWVYPETWRGITTINAAR